MIGCPLLVKAEVHEFRVAAMLPSTTDWQHGRFDQVRASSHRIAPTADRLADRKPFELPSDGFVLVLVEASGHDITMWRKHNGCQ